MARLYFLLHTLRVLFKAQFRPNEDIQEPLPRLRFLLHTPHVLFPVFRWKRDIIFITHIKTSRLGEFLHLMRQSAIPQKGDFAVNRIFFHPTSIAGRYGSAITPKGKKCSVPANAKAPFSAQPCAAALQQLRVALTGQ